MGQKIWAVVNVKKRNSKGPKIVPGGMPQDKIYCLLTKVLGTLRPFDNGVIP